MQFKKRLILFTEASLTSTVLSAGVKGVKYSVIRFQKSPLKTSLFVVRLTLRNFYNIISQQIKYNREEINSFSCVWCPYKNANTSQRANTQQPERPRTTDLKGIDIFDCVRACMFDGYCVNYNGAQIGSRGDELQNVSQRSYARTFERLFQAFCAHEEAEVSFCAQEF